MTAYLEVKGSNFYLTNQCILMSFINGLQELLLKNQENLLGFKTLELTEDCLDDCSEFLSDHPNALYFSLEYCYYLINLNNEMTVIPVNSITKLDLFLMIIN